MAELSKIRKNGVNYDIKDTAAREAIEELNQNGTGGNAVSTFYKGAVTMLDNCQSLSGWSNPFGGNAPTLDTENYLFGSASVRSNAVMQKKISDDGFNFDENNLVIKLRINSVVDGARLRLYLSDASAFTGYLIYDLYKEYNARQFSPGEWVELTINRRGYSEGPGGIDYQAVKYARFNGNGIDFNIQFIGLRKKTLDKGIVTFTFDDGWDSQMNACKIMASKGITGTLFVIPNAIGDDGKLTLDDCYSAKYDYGCDVQAHYETSLSSYTDEELHTIFNDTQNWIRKNALGNARHFAYPGGVSSPSVVKVARRYFDTCRTIYSGIPAESYPPSEQHRIRAVSAISSASGGINASTVKTYIDGAELDKAWLILVFHRIGEVSSSMDCSEADFTEIIDYALSKDVEIKNYAEVFM